MSVGTVTRKKQLPDASASGGNVRSRGSPQEHRTPAPKITPSEQDPPTPCLFFGPMDLHATPFWLKAFHVTHQMYIAH